MPGRNGNKKGYLGQFHPIWLSSARRHINYGYYRFADTGRRRIIAFQLHFIFVHLCVSRKLSRIIFSYCWRLDWLSGCNKIGWMICLNISESRVNGISRSFSLCRMMSTTHNKQHQEQRSKLSSVVPNRRQNQRRIEIYDDCNGHFFSHS